MGKSPGGWPGQSISMGVFKTLKSANRISIPGLAEGVYCAEVLVEKRRTAHTRRREHYARKGLAASQQRQLSTAPLPSLPNLKENVPLVGKFLHRLGLDIRE